MNRLEQVLFEILQKRASEAGNVMGLLAKETLPDAAAYYTHIPQKKDDVVPDDKIKEAFERGFYKRAEELEKEGAPISKMTHALLSKAKLPFTERLHYVPRASNPAAAATATEYSSSNLDPLNHMIRQDMAGLLRHLKKLPTHPELEPAVKSEYMRILMNEHPAVAKGFHAPSPAPGHPFLQYKHTLDVPPLMEGSPNKLPQVAPRPQRVF